MTRPRCGASGTCPGPTSWNPGGTPGRWTARCVVQPLIEPLYGGSTATRGAGPVARRRLRRRGSRSSAKLLDRVRTPIPKASGTSRLHDGVVAGTAWLRATDARAGPSWRRSMRSELPECGPSARSDSRSSSDADAKVRTAASPTTVGFRRCPDPITHADVGQRGRPGPGTAEPTLGVGETRSS